MNICAIMQVLLHLYPELCRDAVIYNPTLSPIVKTSFLAALIRVVGDFSDIVIHIAYKWILHTTSFNG